VEDRTALCPNPVETLAEVDRWLRGLLEDLPPSPGARAEAAVCTACGVGFRRWVGVASRPRERCLDCRLAGRPARRPRAAENRICCAAPGCTVIFVPAGERNRYCSAECRPSRRLVRCAGTCGRMIGGSPLSLPEGQRMCQPCRRAALSYRVRQPAPPRPAIVCAHPACDAVIEKPTAHQKWCSKTCSDRAPTAKPRNARKNARRRSAPRAASAWQKLRAQVLGEEPNCWVCDQPIDPAIAWPDPMSGSGDHVVPLEAGGAQLDRDNVRAAHMRCNQQRHTEWKRQQRAVRRADLRIA